MAGDQTLVDVEVGQQALRVAGILACDHIDLAKRRKRAQRDVLEIPDRSGNHE
jgi:hypothetical protein